MKQEKKPDSVVFDEEAQEYNAKLLPYASGVGAPKINPPDIGRWKNTNITTANHQFKSRYEAIREAYQELMEQFEYNTLVYSAQYNFEPITGETYHLYKSKDKSSFLSLIAPNECGFEHMGSFRLGPDKMWEKL
ncbi:MAG: DUF2452 domain-containing protein [Bacteroidota bacterium]